MYLYINMKKTSNLSSNCLRIQLLKIALMNEENILVNCEQCSLKPTAQIKFQDLYQNFVFSWNKIYTCLSKATIDCKIREFQYKMLNRILYTNKILFKMKLVESLLNSFCKEFDESLNHLLYCCTFAREHGSSLI